MSVRKGWAVAVLVAVAIGVASAAADGVYIGVQTVPTYRFHISPEELPRTHPAQVRMAASGKYRTGDGRHVAALRELEIEGDKDIALDLKGVPVCRPSGYDNRGSIEDRCRDALIGGGKLTVEVAFPEQPVTWVPGRLHLYNGSRTRNRLRLLAVASLPAPVPAELLVPITIRRIHDQRFAWRATADVPKIAGGSGSIFGYSVRVGKRFLRATCGDGRFELSTASIFADGEKITGRTIQTCSVAEPHVRQ